MGKDLKGKELGDNLSQRKDKKYVARFTDKYGNRHSHINKSLVECKKWLANNAYNKEHSDLYTKQNEISVKAWYDYWIEYKENTVKRSTLLTYKNLWIKHIEPVIGKMLMKDVKVQHCQLILNNMAKAGKAEKYISDIKRAYNNFFDLAMDYEIINKNPLAKANARIGRKTAKKKALTINQQKEFLQMVKGSSYYNYFALILQTGMRIAEVVGLKWCDVDFAEKTITIKQQLHMLNNVGWEFSTPKSKTSRRVIPMTDEAERILKEQKRLNNRIKIIPFEWQDLVFLNEYGKPTCQDTIDNFIKHISKANNIEPTSCHILRHTFATRCIEGGIQPKALQAIMGHSSLSITMDLYVDASEDLKSKELYKVQNCLTVNF